MLYYNHIETNQNNILFKKGKMNMIKCGLCGKEFKDDQFDEYAAHVNQCAAEHSMKKKTEDMKKIQAELEEVKRAKVCYEGLRNAFKEKYPDIYKMNFGDESKVKSKDSENNKDKVKTSTSESVSNKSKDKKDNKDISYYDLFTTPTIRVDDLSKEDYDNLMYLIDRFNNIGFF